MVTIVTRAGKGSPLTNTELDANFNNLNTGITSRKIDKAGASGAVSTYAVARNPLTAGGQERIVAGRDFGLALDGSTDDAPALNDMIQKVGARGGGYIDIATDLTVGGASVAYMKTLSTINNNVSGVTIRGTHFANGPENRESLPANPSGLVIVPNFDGIACRHFTPFSSTAVQVTGGGFEHITVVGNRTGSGSSQILLDVDGILRGSYIMSLLNPRGIACARFISRDRNLINEKANTSIQYCKVDLYCRAGFETGSNTAAHGVIMTANDTWTSFGTSGNVSHNRDWHIDYEGVNGKALWNRSGDSNANFILKAGQGGQANLIGVNDFIWANSGENGSSVNNGTWPLVFSGGTAASGQTIIPPTGTYTVGTYTKLAAAGNIVKLGCVIDYTITSPGSGYDKTQPPPTVSFPKCPSASATCVMGVILYYADCLGKSKPSVVGGQSQGFACLSGKELPIILEGTEVPNAGSLYPIENSATASIYEGYIDRGNSTPFPTTGTQAFAHVRDQLYGIDYHTMAAKPVFGSDQSSVFFAKKASVSSPAAFIATSSAAGGGGLGTAAEFLFYGNTMSVRFEDDTVSTVKLKDSSNILTSLKMYFGLEIKPGIGTTQDPTLIGGMTFEAASDTQAYVKVKGSDGVIRKAGLPLSVSGTSGSGTVTSVAALTLGTTGTDLSSSVANSTTTPVITLNVPTASASARGALSAADWSTFNGKQSSGAAASFTSLAYSTTLTGGTGVINIGSGQLYKDASGNLGIGTTAPGEKLSIAGSANVFMSLLTTGVIKTQFFATDANGQGGVNTVTNHPFTIGANNDPKVIVQPSGNMGIGNIGGGFTPAASALLDVQSTTKGVRFPNMTTAEKNAISSPALGLVVFDTTLAKLCVYTGAWQTITSV